MTPTLVWYAVGPVHPRNLELLAPELPGWNFRLTYEPDVWWRKAIESSPFERIPLGTRGPPPALWAGDVRAVVFSTVQARPAPLRLLRAALERGLPTIAIEESNQVALNRGAVNNYLLPVDRLLVASDVERAGMVDAGVPRQRIEVTGWPFYGGRTGAASPSERRDAKHSLGLDPDRRVAALTLTALGDAGETPEVRRRQLDLAQRGTPDDHQLVVKPHPIEKPEALRPFLARHAPRAIPLDGRVSVDRLLDAADVLLNRGASQVCIEALHHEVPVVVLETGVRTPFHESAPDAVADSPERLHAAIRAAETDAGLRRYQPFLRQHAPIPPPAARRGAAQRLAQFRRGHAPHRAAGVWLELALYSAWQTRDAAGAAEARIDPRLRPALRRLAGRRAGPEDIVALRPAVADGFVSHVLRALFVECLERRRSAPDDATLVWLRDFPPATNTGYFSRSMDRWAHVLLRNGLHEEAASLAQRLRRDFPHIDAARRTAEGIDLYQRGLRGRVLYRLRRLPSAARGLTHPIRSGLARASR